MRLASLLVAYVLLVFGNSCLADDTVAFPPWASIAPGTCLTYDLVVNGDGPVKTSEFRITVDIVSVTHGKEEYVVTGEVSVSEGLKKIATFDLVASHDGKTLEVEGNGVTISVAPVRERTAVGSELAFDVQARGVGELPTGTLRITDTDATSRSGRLSLSKVTVAKLQWDYCESSGQVMVVPRFGLTRLALSATWGSGVLKLVDAAEDDLSP